MAKNHLSVFLADVERDLSWRQGEIRTLNRLLSATKEEDGKKPIRRALIVLLYAHLEGGMRTATSAYVRVVNDHLLEIENCNPFIVASAWEPVFRDLGNSGSKGHVLTNRLPDEPKVHTLARRANFVSKLRTLQKMKVSIDDQDVVDLEGNVSPTVVVKMLYRLGFSEDDLKAKFKDLQYLLKTRNYVAHGEDVSVTSEQCAKYEEATFRVLTRMRDMLSKGISSRAYSRTS